MTRSCLIYFDPWYHPWSNASNSEIVAELDALRAKIVKDNLIAKDLETSYKDLHAYEADVLEFTTFNV